MAQTQVSIRINDLKVDHTFTLPFELEQPKKSGGNVVKLGLILFCLSTCLAVNAFTVGVISTRWQTSGITISCSLLFILLSLMAMYGEGGDNKLEKQILVACLGLAIVGIGAIIVGIIFNINSWHEVRRFCTTCTDHHDLDRNTNNSIFFDEPSFENSSEIIDYVTIDNNSFVSNIDDYEPMISSSDNFIFNATDAVSSSHENLASSYNYSTEISSFNSTEISVFNSTEISVFNFTETPVHPRQAVCQQLCSTWRTSLFLILIILLISNSVMSIGLSYVIFTIRFRNSDYLAAISV